MEYIIRMTETCPDGSCCGTMYYKAENEHKMERFINAFKEGHDYLTVTCLGPILSPPKYVKDIVDEHV